jgi:hypothetical protein
MTTAGGRFATGLPVPNTLLRSGSTAIMCDAGAAASSAAGTENTFRATGRAFTKVSRETTVTPPFTFRFAYEMPIELRLMTTAL